MATSIDRYNSSNLLDHSINTAHGSTVKKRPFKALSTNVKGYFEALYKHGNLGTKPLPTTLRNARVDRMQMNNKYDHGTVFDNIVESINKLSKTKVLAIAQNERTISVKKSAKNNAQLTAMQRIFDACLFALENEFTEVTKGYSIRGDVLKKLKKTQWFKHLASSNQEINSEIKLLIKKFKTLEKRIQYDQEVMHVAQLSREIFGEKHKTTLNHLSEALSQKKELKAEMETQKKDLEKIKNELGLQKAKLEAQLKEKESNLKSSVHSTQHEQIAFKEKQIVDLKAELENVNHALFSVPFIKENLVSITLFLRVDKSHFSNLDEKTGRILSKLQDDVKSCENEIRQQTKMQQNSLKKQMVLKMRKEGSDPTKKMHEVLSPSTLLHAYQWLMTTPELFEIIKDNLTSLEKFIQTNKRTADKFLLKTAKKQQIALLDFCKSWMESKMYTQERTEEVRKELTSIFHLASHMTSQHVKDKATKLSGIEFDTSLSAMNTHLESIKPYADKKTLDVTLQAMQSKLNTFLSRKNVEPYWLDELVGQFASHYMDQFNQVELLDLFNQNKPNAIHWKALAVADNTITTSTASALRSLKREEFIKALQFYDIFIKHCINKCNFATARSIYCGVSQFLMQNTIPDKELLKKYEDYCTFFLKRDKKLETSHKKITECINAKIPFIPTTDYVGFQFEQIGIVSEFKEVNAEKGILKVNIEQMQTVEILVKQWFEIKGFFKDFAV